VLFVKKKSPPERLNISTVISCRVSDAPRRRSSHREAIDGVATGIGGARGMAGAILEVGMRNGALTRKNNTVSW